MLPPVPGPSTHFSIHLSLQEKHFKGLLQANYLDPSLPQQAAGCHSHCHNPTTIHAALKKCILTPSSHHSPFPLYSQHHHSSGGSRNCSSTLSGLTKSYSFAKCLLPFHSSALQSPWSGSLFPIRYYRCLLEPCISPRPDGVCQNH